jgi:type I restriction enzyme, S subunit
LFAKITPCMQNGKHAIARNLTDGIGFGSTEFHVLRPGPRATAEWIHFFLSQPCILQDAAAQLTGAVGQQRLPEDYLSSLEIPLAPAADQRRIAARLREQLAQVAKARAAIQAQLDAAEALPAAHLRSVFDGPIARRWPRRRLADLLKNTRNGLYKPDTFCGRGERILKMFNIGPFDGTWNLNRVDLIEVTPEEHESYRLLPGDILVNRVNSRELVGKCALVDERTAGCVFESKNIRIRIRSELARSDYMAICLNSAAGRRQFQTSLKQIVGQATVNRADLDAFELPLPQMSEQLAVAKGYAQTTSGTSALRNGLVEQLTALDHLPAALLRKAFAGRI